MNRVLLLLLFALLLLSQSPTSSARLLQGDEDVNYNVITHSDSSVKTPDDSLYDALMGLEECDKKVESCLKRKMVEEAHLDYIYTQHHKP